MYGNRWRYCSAGIIAGWLTLAGCVSSDHPAVCPLPRDPGVWTSPDGLAVESAGPQSLRFVCPFPSGADRHVWDVPVAMDLSNADGLEISYTLENPGAFRGVTWYLRSGPGWWAAALPVADGPQRVWVPWSAFEAQEAPAGWDRISAFRLSPWAAGRGGGGAVVLHDVQARSASVAILEPESMPNPQELAFGQRAAAQWAADFSRLAVAYRMVSGEAVAGLDAGRVRVLVLPYNPGLSSDLLRALRRYVDRGGALLVSYNADAELAALVGVRVGSWQAAGRSGQWHAMVFSGPDWQGPAQVLSPGTPHLLPVYPASADAELLAVWQDAAGRVQPEAAVVVSPRGAWFSYLPGADDEQARQRMVAFLLDRHLPGSAAAALRAELAGWAADAGSAPAEFTGALRAVEAALEAGRVGSAWDAWTRLRGRMQAALASGVALPRGVPQGIWDHSGEGLYPGDWSRTMAELAAAGFSDVFVYVPRTGRLSPQAVPAAREAGLRVHAWHICLNLDGVPEEALRRWRAQGRLQTGLNGATTAWLCPSIPENRAMERERVVQRSMEPGLAGVHLDYVRYPDADHCYGACCRRAFEAEYGRRVAAWPEEVRSGPLRETFQAWRAEQVSRLVAEIAEAVRTRFPGLALSVAVWPDLDTVVERQGQDWPRWLGAGWVDIVLPMSYTGSVEELAAWTTAHAALPAAGDRIWSGLGVRSAHTRLTPGQTLAQARAALEAGAAGWVVFDLTATVRDELFPVLARLAEGGVDD